MSVGIVVIGRNEGKRLQDCLGSCLKYGNAIIYADSASSDGSSNVARSLGCHVIDLDPTLPFTAARARNEGFDFLLEKYPGLQYIQFIDGDCTLDPYWLPIAVGVLENNSTIACVCGSRVEKYPEHSIYNALCDIEWTTPIGKASSCGGDAVYRRSSFEEAGGFNRSFSAGEEPEFCYRIRKLGFEVHRLNVDMTIHDAEIMRFGQWWNRAKRSGSAYAQMLMTHGAEPEHLGFKQSASIWFWSFLLPSAILLVSFSIGPVHLLWLPLAYILRIGLSFRTAILRRLEGQIACVYAVSLWLIKFPQLIGQIEFYLRGSSKLIEYK